MFDIHCIIIKGEDKGMCDMYKTTDHILEKCYGLIQVKFISIQIFKLLEKIVLQEQGLKKSVFRKVLLKYRIEHLIDVKCYIQ